MALHYTAKIKKNLINKIGILDNSSTKLSITVAYNKLKAKYPNKEIYISNCGFFNMTSKLEPIMGVKINGLVKSNYWDLNWMGMKNSDIKFEIKNSLPNNYTDAVTGYPTLIENHKKSSSFNYCLPNTDRGRTMLGYTEDEVILSVVGDTADASDFTLDEELNYMLMLNCEYAINLDGGGSSQCVFNGSKIYSSRIVSNFIYIVADKDMSKTELQVQQFLNNTYSAKLTVDGILGTATKKAIIKGMQKELGVTADGIWGNASKKAFKYLGVNSKNNTTNQVKLLQCILCKNGFWDGNIDGVYNIELKNKVIAYQKSKGLSADGICGVMTINKLFG